MGPRMREDNGREGAHEGRSYGGRGVGEADFYDDERSPKDGRFPNRPYENDNWGRSARDGM